LHLNVYVKSLIASLIEHEQVGKVQRHLGIFVSQEEAAREYDRAAVVVRGRCEGICMEGVRTQVTESLWFARCIFFISVSLSRHIIETSFIWLSLCLQ
jgi:hypothetical protein